jgi:hypothetical protein
MRLDIVAEEELELFSFAKLRKVNIGTYLKVYRTVGRCVLPEIDTRGVKHPDPPEYDLIAQHYAADRCLLGRPVFGRYVIIHDPVMHRAEILE